MRVYYFVATKNPVFANKLDFHVVDREPESIEFIIKKLEIEHGGFAEACRQVELLSFEKLSEHYGGEYIIK